VSSVVNVFDVTKHPSTPADGAGCTPQIRCVGHEKEGYGINWSTFQKGLLVSGSDDSLICMWDIASSLTTPSATAPELAPLATYRAHESVVEDVSFHRHHKDLFGSVGDDKKVIVWDKRKKENAPTHNVVAHTAEVNCLSFSPFNQFLMLTGSSDQTVALWDMRKMEDSLHSFTGHTAEVFQVEWSAHNEGVFASGSGDRRVHVWDVAQIGAEQTAEDAEDGPPELMFIHGGHTSKISDFSWNSNEQFMAASVAEDNILQIWQMAENIYCEDEEGDEDDEDLE
jgi:histone-binding protein RBBP4